MSAAAPPADAQQFNSDSYLLKPVGMATLILTYGERNTMLMNTFSLLPRWEFTVAGYFYNDDNDRATDDGYSTSLYAKYMFYENQAKTGGFAVKAGTGLDPGYLDVDNGLNDAFKTFWTNAPLTLPLFGNADLKPLRSRAWEATYWRVVSPQSMYSLTYFYRSFVDLLATPCRMPCRPATRRKPRRRRAGG